MLVQFNCKQVSVRRAALSALSSLLSLFPSDAAVCGAWVRSVLPLVRDAESGVQDAVLDAFQALLVDRAAAAGAGGAAAAAAMRPLLAALQSVGRAAGSCVARLCAMLAAKQRLKGKQARDGCALHSDNAACGTPAWLTRAPCTHCCRCGRLHQFAVFPTHAHGADVWRSPDATYDSKPFAGCQRLGDHHRRLWRCRG